MHASTGYDLKMWMADIESKKKKKLLIDHVKPFIFKFLYFV